MPACRHCYSTQTVKHGFTRFDKQRFRCKSCQRTFVEDPAQTYSEADKERILSAYHERMSLRGIERTFGVARQTVANWLKKSPVDAAGAPG